MLDTHNTHEPATTGWWRSDGKNGRRDVKRGCGAGGGKAVGNAPIGGADSF